MIVTTATNIEGFEIERYIGIVSGEVVMGLNFFKDWIAGIKDWMGGRVFQYEKEIRQGKRDVIQMMVDRANSVGANAIIGVTFDYEVMSPKKKGTVITIVGWGTAVYVREKRN